MDKDSESILIVGAGFCGLTSALCLAAAGKKVTIVEKADKAGGLAQGFKEKNWEWFLEQHYHHIFESDNDILKLAKEVKAGVNFKEAVTSIWDGSSSHRFDSPVQILKYQGLTILSRIRLLAGMGILKILPWGTWL